MIWFQLIINNHKNSDISIKKRIKLEYGYDVLEQKGVFKNSTFTIAYTNTNGLVCVVEDNLLLLGECNLHNRQELTEAYDLSVTATTSEILMTVYKKLGSSFIREILGEFSFVLYDGNTKNIITYRDPLGLRTAFYTKISQYLVISSDLFLLESSFTKLQKDYFKFFYYTNGFLEQSLTPFENVYRVRKGTYIQHINFNESKEKKYWDLVDLPSLNYRNKEDYAKELKNRLSSATQNRMLDRTHCAVMLSGGLDSTSVYALAQESYPISSVSAVFDELKESDERQSIEEVLGMYQGKGHFTPCDDVLILSKFPYNSPFTYEPVVTAMTHEFTLHTLEFAKSLKFNEILSGFGGDQVLFSSLYTTGDYLKKGQIKRILETITEYSIRTNSSALSNLAKYTLFPKVYDDVLNHIEGLNQFEDYASYQSIKSPAKQMLYFQIQSLSTSYLDRTLGAMTNIDVRHPFLDQRLIEFLFQIPAEVSYSNDFEKQLLREAMQGYLPNSILTKLNKTTHLAHTYKSIRNHWNQIFLYMSKPIYIIEMDLIDLEKWQTYLNQWRQGVKVSDNFWTLFAIEWWFIKYHAR